MPNMPASVHAASSAISIGTHANDDDKHLTLAWFGSIGKVVLVPESQMGAVTALSGSGPAYIFTMIDAMVSQDLPDKRVIIFRQMQAWRAVCLGQQLSSFLPRQ
jgi:pyrroline-5-carboxylate reductase